MADHNKKQAKSFGEGVRGYMKGLEVVDYRLIISIGKGQVGVKRSH